MSTVSEVIDFLDTFAPPHLAEDWDNIGLLIGRRNAEVRNLLTCLTLTPDVAAEAIAKDVQLVVSHHPVLFRGAKKISDATSEGRMLLDLIENSVAVYSPHTAFDSAALGVNQSLAESFGLTQVRPIRPATTDETLGSGRIGTLLTAVSLTDFLATVKQATNAGYLEFNGPLESKVSKVAVACGAAAEFLDDAMSLGCDTFVTGEARFHSALQARTEECNLILLGHYSSERPAIERLAKILGLEFSQAVCFASEMEADPLSVYQI